MNMRQVFHFFKPIPGYQTAHALPYNDILFSAAAGSLLLIDQFNCALEKSGIGLDRELAVEKVDVDDIVLAAKLIKGCISLAKPIHKGMKVRVTEFFVTHIRISIINKFQGVKTFHDNKRFGEFAGTARGIQIRYTTGSFFTVIG